MRIGIIDDDTDILHFLSRELELKHKVSWFSWLGQEGFRGLKWKILSAKVDLFILDVNLPGTNGFIIGDEIRKSFGHEVPIIYMSAVASKSQFYYEDQRNTYFLPKPLRKNDINEAVETMSMFI